MTPRDEAKLAQLNAKIEKTEEEIKKLEAMKANYQSQELRIFGDDSLSLCKLSGCIDRPYKDTSAKRRTFCVG